MDEPNADQFAEMALQMHQQPDMNATLESIVEHAQEATRCDDAGVMLLGSRGRIETVVTTHPRVAEADRLQMDCGEGPCLQAIWERDVYIVAETGQDKRWPVWGPKAAELGLRSLLALRLFTPNRTLGALNLYGERPEMFSEDDADIAEVFARHASVALATAHEEEGLRQAISARHLIGQAQGILMERYGLNADRAFALLRRYSQHHNVKLRDVAQLVISSGKLPDQE